MADMNNVTPQKSGTDAPKANFAYIFGLVTVIGGGSLCLISLIALFARQGQWILFNSICIAGIILSIVGKNIANKVSPTADPYILNKANRAKTLCGIGLIINIVATVLMVIGIFIFFSLLASGDYTFQYGW